MMASGNSSLLENSTRISVFLASFTSLFVIIEIGQANVYVFEMII